jgi:hypothetical protein
MRLLKQSTAKNLVVFMVDSTDHITGKTGLTLTITASKDGAAFASISPTVTELGSGWYNLALTTTHTNTLGDLALHITSTGADASDLVSHVVAFDFADAVSLGLSRIDAAISSRNAVAPDNTSITAIKAKTDNLPAAPAATGDAMTLTSAERTTLTASIWNALTSGLSTVGSIGKLVVTNLDALVSSRMATFTYTAPDNTSITAIKSKTDNLPAAPASTSDVTTVGTSVAAVKVDTAAIKLKTDNLPSDPADASDIAGSFTTVNSTLATIAGYIDTEVAAIKAKTDNLPSTPASQSDVTTVGTAVAAVKVDTAAIKTKTDNLPTDPADESNVLAAIAAIAQDTPYGRALNDYPFPMATSSGAPATGLSVTAKISKDGGAFATCNNAVVEISDGVYKIDLTASEMTANTIFLKFSAAGAQETNLSLVTQS